MAWNQICVPAQPPNSRLIACEQGLAFSCLEGRHFPQEMLDNKTDLKESFGILNLN